MRQEFPPEQIFVGTTGQIMLFYDQWLSTGLWTASIVIKYNVLVESKVHSQLKKHNT